MGLHPGRKPNIWQLNQKPLRRGKAPAVFPNLLPQDHQLRLLDKAGVIAVEPVGNDYDFRVVVDATKAGVAIEGGQTLVIDVIMDPETQDLLLPSIDDFYGDTRLSKTVTAAAVLARRMYTPESLKGNEIREINSVYSNWNRAGNTPKLIYTEQVHPDAKTVMYPLGKKTVLYTIDEGISK